MLSEERLARIETRIVQIMLYLGMDPYTSNKKGGITSVLCKEAEPYGKTDADAATDDARVDWTPFDRPAHQRRRENSAITNVVPTGKEIHKYPR